MKIIFILPVVLGLVSAAAISSDDDSSVRVYTDSDELDPFTAQYLENFSDVKDGSDSDDDDDQLVDEESDVEDVSDKEPDVIHARVDEDGNIEVEDMVLSPDMFDVMFPLVTAHPDNNGKQSVHKRAAITSRRWPGRRVAYSYNSNLLGSQSKIRTAMNEWEKYTCVKFAYRSRTETKYVQFRTKMDSKGKPVNVCSSSLGYYGRLQYINLAKNCFSHRTLLHEIGHTLGLIHEHQHPSRDSYITVIWDNVNPVKKSNFKAKTGVSSYGLAYDPLSIMHYRSTAFRKSGCKSPCYTMLSKKGSSTTRLMGTATRLSSKSDIPIVKMMYKC